MLLILIKYFYSPGEKFFIDTDIIMHLPFQLRTLNSVAHLDTLQEAILEKIKALGLEYGARAETLIEGLQQDLTAVRRQKRLGIGKLAEANFHIIRVKQQVIRDSYIAKNLSKLVSLILHRKLNLHG